MSCPLVLDNISKEKIKFWVKEGSPGGAKVAKNEFFCNNLAKTKNIFF